MRAVDVGLDGADGAFDDEFDADSGSEMNDDIGIVDELGKQLTILNVIEVILHAAGRLEMADILDAAGRKVVEQNNMIVTLEESLGEMRADKTGAASNQIAQKASLQSLGVIIIVVIAGDVFGDGFRSFCSLGRFTRFLRTISIRIRIITVRVIIVGGAGIHSIENDAENVALHAIEQVARSSEGFLGGLAAANHEEHAVGLHGEDHGIRGGHDRRRIDDDKLVLGAELGDGLDELV